jgi:predicted ATP-grasp superfamily ATP-dependent carboligase
MTVSESTEELGFNNAGIKVFEDNDLNKKQAATTREGLMRMLTYNEKSLKEKRCFVLPHFSA